MLLIWRAMLLLGCVDCCLSTGQPCVVGVVGGWATLPCVDHHAEDLEMGNGTVEWRSSQGAMVHSSVSGEEPPYSGRAQLLAADRRSGDLSLRLSSITLADAQDYHCYRSTAGQQTAERLCRVCLTAAARYSEPELHRVPVPEGGDAQFSCSSSGGFPEPRVHWLLNSQRPPVDTERTHHTQDPVTGLVSVSSRLTVSVHSTQDISVSCTIENPRLNESRSSSERSYSVQAHGLGVKWVFSAALCVAVAVMVAATLCYQISLDRKSMRKSRTWTEELKGGGSSGSLEEWGGMMVDTELLDSLTETDV
ncbi:ICOS ligand-like [Amia ocellicauda]|uniref:ICOS ligand-like n=1 Tax=Amia ocellicauda TaxID=2972642 RepID=UPI0034645101